MPFKTPHPLYSVWQGMLRRCYTPTTRGYSCYGGRGITVCDRWRGPDGFKHFVADMGERPDGHSIDRVDNNKNYSPDNCRWATRKQQQYNLRTTRKVLIEGREYVVAELANLHGLKSDTVARRVSHGLTFDEVTSPVPRRSKVGLALGGKANGRKQQAKTHCPGGHLYDEKNTLLTPEGYRQCRACHAERERRKRELKKQA